MEGVPATRKPIAVAAERRRWYGHGWNRPIAWELILRITPHLPRPLLEPLHHLTTLICFASMSRERAAARRNLQRVTGRNGLANLRLAYRLFYNFGRFLVAYTELRGLDPEQMRSRVAGAEEGEGRIAALLAEGRGVIIASMHLGHWDLGLKLLSHFRVPVHVVMLSEDPAEVTRYADEARRIPQMRVYQMGSTPLLAVELMLALKRGHLVAILSDRPVGQNVIRLPLFGHETDLPTGPVQLAMATGAPILPTYLLFEGRRRYRLVTHPPLRFDRPSSEESPAALREAMGRLIAVMESTVADHPDQWFNFYDVWPEEGDPGRA